MYRLLQKITGIHRIHHVKYSYGWKLPYGQWAYFKKCGFKKVHIIYYHDCTNTNIY